MNDFNENVYYEEIIRLGFKISLDVIKEEYNQSYDAIKQNDADLIEYLRSICSDGNIYTPNYDFHINLPKVLSKKKLHRFSEIKKIITKKMKLIVVLIKII